MTTLFYRTAALLLVFSLVMGGCLNLFDHEQGGVELSVTSEGAVLFNYYKTEISYIAMMESVYENEEMPERDEWEVLPAEHSINVPFNKLIGFNYEESYGYLFWYNERDDNEGSFVIDLAAYNEGGGN